MSGELRLMPHRSFLALQHKTKRIMTKKLWTLAVSLLISFTPILAQEVPENQLVIPAKTNVIPFTWQGDSIHSVWEPHTAMLVPVKLKHCARTFYMQFDLGSPYSLLYKNKTDAIRAKYPRSLPPDTAAGQLYLFSFKTGKVKVTARKILVNQYDSSAIDWSHTNGIEVIGTLGADMIDGRVASIDYPGRTITLSQDIPHQGDPVKMVDFMYAYRRVLLPAKIKGRETLLYFDTGSSMFELLASKETVLQLAVPNASPQQFPVRSWNRTLTANVLASDQSIEIAHTLVPLHSSAYIDGVSDTQVKQMLKMGISGMTGNKLFLNYVLILDTKNNKFGLKRKG